jgi:Spy/CpxP family protein refolding chaperone
MKKKILIIGLILGFISTGSLMAQRGAGRMMQAQQPDQPRFMERIPDLTEQQEEKIISLREEHFKNMQELRDDMATLHTELYDLTSGADYDTKAAMKKIDAITNLQNKIMKERQNHRDAVRNQLTDKQKVFFDQHWGLRMQGKKGRVGRGYHKPGFRPGNGYGPCWDID